MLVLNRLLREPLLHFMVFGAVLFGFYAALNESPTTTDSGRIFVTEDDVTRLLAQFRRTWSRSPTPNELKELITAYVRNEVYYREALALGLDQNDTVIRQRLQQKMEFLIDAQADLSQPNEGDLQAWLTKNQDKYRHSPQIAFEQVYLGVAPTLKKVETARQSLNSVGEAVLSIASQSILLPSQVELSSQQSVDAIFGRGFFRMLEALPVGNWSGPVTSAYGKHLVRVKTSKPGMDASLNEVRLVVQRDWQAARVQEVREAAFSQIQKRYEVVITDTITPRDTHQ